VTDLQDKIFMDKTYYKRNLPHYQPDDAIFFVTFRLANSLPRSVVEDLIKENEILERRIEMMKDKKEKLVLLKDYKKRYFAKFDQLLDSNISGSMWLKENNIAEIIKDSIHHRDKKVYRLFSYCIMPNHVHMLCGTGKVFLEKEQVDKSNSSDEVYGLTRILQDLKKYTAKESNKILNRKGQFWHNESYDHVVRNVQEFDNITDYIAQNPVKAGLAMNPKDWRFSYVNNSPEVRQQVDEFFSR